MGSAPDLRQSAIRDPAAYASAAIPDRKRNLPKKGHCDAEKVLSAERQAANSNLEVYNNPPAKP